MVVQKAVVMIGMAAVLDVNDNAIDLIFGEQIKVVGDTANGIGEGFFGFDMINDQVNAENSLHKRGEHVWLGEGFFEDHAITQGGNGLHGDTLIMTTVA